MSVFVAIFGLLLLVLIHEAGHFLAAKAVGLRATKFYVGFPPAIAKVRRGDTEYGLGGIPLGGYVKITGMARPRTGDIPDVLAAVQEAAKSRDPDERDLLAPAYARVDAALRADDQRDLVATVEELRAALERDAHLIDPERMEWARKELDRMRDDVDERSYWRQPVWKRVVTIAAGPLANIIAAVVILTIFFASGPPKYAATLKVDQVGVNSPASKAGLKPGDVVLSVNGTRAKDSEQVRSLIQKPGQPTLTVRRSGQVVTLKPATPVKGADGKRYLEFTFDVVRNGSLHYGPVAAVGAAKDDIWFTTRETFKALGKVVTGGDRSNLTTPVGIVQASEDSQSSGSYPRLLALISLSLAIFNLLPFLPLDGGHILFALIEKLRRRPVRREIYERVSVIGIAAMLLLFMVGLSNDIGRITSGPTITP
jgi:regulator of sigma E protease